MKYSIITVNVKMKIVISSTVKDNFTEAVLYCIAHEDKKNNIQCLMKKIKK